MGEGDGVGERRVGVDLRRRLRDAAELEQVHDAPVAGLQLGLAVAGRRGRGEHVAGHGQPLGDMVRGPQRDAAGVERGGERGRIARAPRLLHGAGAELAGAARVGVVELDRQPCEQPRGRRGITRRHARERLLEQVHGGGVGGRDDDRHPAVAEGRPGEERRVAGGAGPPGGLGEGGARPASPPGAVLGAAQREQHLGSAAPGRAARAAS